MVEEDKKIEKGIVNLLGVTSTKARQKSLTAKIDDSMHQISVLENRLKNNTTSPVEMLMQASGSKRRMEVKWMVMYLGGLLTRLIARKREISLSSTMLLY